MKPFRAKLTRLTRSKSPGLFETCVSTPSETPVTPTISGIPASTKEVPQLQEDIRTDPSVIVNTSILEPAPYSIDSEGVTPPASVTAESITSLALEIFYEPNGLPLPLGLIAIEEIMEDLPSSTPSHFGIGIHLYPSTSEVNTPSSQVPVELLGSLLDRLDMSGQPSTSRTVSSDTAVAKPPATTPVMFAGIPYVPTSSQPLEGVHPGIVLTVWSVPTCSSRIISGISYVESQ